MDGEGIGETDLFSTSCLAAFGGIGPIGLAAGADSKGLEAPPIQCIGVELRFQILEIQGKVQHLHLHAGLALRRLYASDGQGGNPSGCGAKGLEKAAAVGGCGDDFIDQRFRHG